MDKVGSSMVLWEFFLRCRVRFLALWSWCVRWFWRYVGWFSRKPELGMLSLMLGMVFVCMLVWIWFLVGFGEKVGVNLNMGPFKVEGSPVTVNTYVGVGGGKDGKGSGTWKRVSGREVAGTVNDGVMTSVP